MQIDWADPLSQPGAMTGLGCSHDGMGSWLSSLLKRNKNTLSKIVAPLVGGVATVVTAGGAAPILGTVLAAGSSLLSTLGDPKSLPQTPAPTTAPATETKSSALPLLVGAGALALLLSRK